MRKLWPPTYDNVSVRVWAAFISAAINLLLCVLFFSGSEVVFWGALPGIMPAIFLSAMAGYGEWEFIPIVGTAVVIACNFCFYYLVSWILINMFTPSTNWWPQNERKKEGQ